MCCVRSFVVKLQVVGVIYVACGSAPLVSARASGLILHAPRLRLPVPGTPAVVSLSRRCHPSGRLSIYLDCEALLCREHESEHRPSTPTEPSSDEDEKSGRRLRLASVAKCAVASRQWTRILTLQP